MVVFTYCQAERKIKSEGRHSQAQIHKTITNLALNNKSPIYITVVTQHYCDCLEVNSGQIALVIVIESYFARCITGKQRARSRN